MGATTFNTTESGETASAAFQAAVSSAQWEHGHGGYTGSIAEKRDYVMIRTEPMDHDAAYQLAEQLLDADDSRIADQWGPAGCIPVDDPQHGKAWLFFGWASE